MSATAESASRLRVLVTGASGNVGREVVRALAERGLLVRAATRAADVIPSADENVALDFEKPSTFQAAARGCEAMFLMRPPHIANVRPTLNAFIDAARTEGVRHVSFLSVTGAGTNRIVPHHAVEEHLQRSSDDFTLLRPGFFSQNIETEYRRDILESDRLYVPAGAGRVRWVDVRDIADVAAITLREPAMHRRHAYDLTGAEALGFADAAAILASVTGRAIHYDAASIYGYARHLRRRHYPWMRVVVQTVLHVAMRRGQTPFDPTLGTLLGRPPRTLLQYIVEKKNVWTAGPAL